MHFEILEKPLLKSLLDGTIPFYDVMNAYNVKTTLSYQLPSHVLGFVYVSRRGNYHLILNADVNYETQCRTFVHEIKHIVHDLPSAGYIIGLNMQHSGLEQETDCVAEVLGEYVVEG
ncbi:MAG: hypothetical protein GX783_12245 [Clostridiales bacterium]|jgi:hypothetical protein|nr:hypothetical protein [Clostridiales bacterium]